MVDLFGGGQPTEPLPISDQQLRELQADEDFAKARLESMADLLNKIIDPSKPSFDQNKLQVIMKEYGLAYLVDYEIESALLKLDAAHAAFSMHKFSLCRSIIEEVINECLFSRSKGGQFIKNVLTASTSSTRQIFTNPAQTQQQGFMGIGGR